MRRGTTPTVTLTVTNEDGTPIDLTGQEVHVTFQESGRDGVTFTKRETDEGVAVSVDGDASIVEVTLTQAETLRFRTGRKVRVQVRCKDLDVAIATDIGQFDAEEILLDGEI